MVVVAHVLPRLEKSPHTVFLNTEKKSLPFSSLPLGASTQAAEHAPLAHGRLQDSVYIVAVLGRTSMVEPSEMLDVGLCSAAIPDTAVPCGLLC